MTFGFLPQFVESLETNVLRTLSFSSQAFFDVAEAAVKFFIGGGERLLGFDVEMARVIDDGENQIAEFFRYCRPAPAFSRTLNLLIQFGQFFDDFCPRALGVGPVKTDGGGAFLNRQGTDQRAIA